MSHRRFCLTSAVHWRYVPVDHHASLESHALDMFALPARGRGCGQMGAYRRLIIEP